MAEKQPGADNELLTLHATEDKDSHCGGTVASEAACTPGQETHPCREPKLPAPPAGWEARTISPAPTSSMASDPRSSDFGRSGGILPQEGPPKDLVRSERSRKAGIDRRLQGFDLLARSGRHGVFNTPSLPPSPPGSPAALMMERLWCATCARRSPSQGVDATAKCRSNQRKNHTQKFNSLERCQSSQTMASQGI